MEKDKVFRFRLSKDLLDKAQAKAKKDNIKLSKVVRDFLNEFVKEDSK